MGVSWSVTIGIIFGILTFIAAVLGLWATERHHNSEATRIAKQAEKEAQRKAARRAKRRQQRLAKAEKERRAEEAAKQKEVRKAESQQQRQELLSDFRECAVGSSSSPAVTGPIK